MSRSVVVDASALLKLALDEPGAEATERWFHEAWTGGTELVAPPHLHAEVGRVLQRETTDLSPAEQAGLHAAMLDYVGLLEAHAGDVQEWLCADCLEFFDAAYVAAAMSVDGLCTCDQRMAAAAASFDIPVVDPSQAS